MTGTGAANPGPALAVLGTEGAPTASLLADLERLGYLPTLLTWPADSLPWRGRRPLAALADLRALGVDAARACRALRQQRWLGGAPLVAIVPEPEAARLDLSLGFDDLLLAPYRLTELAARLRLFHWRRQAQLSPEVLQAGVLTLNQATYEVAINQAPIELTLKEYQLLHFLLRHQGRVLTRDELLYHVWGDDYFGGTRTVDVHIRRLRTKIGDATDLIETVRGVGYRLRPPR